GPVTAARLLAVLDAEAVEGAADDLIAHTGKVANTTTADEHDRVFLQVVPFARNVDRHFLAIGEANARDLSKSRVRLLWRHRADDEANALLLRTFIEHGALGDLALNSPRLADELVDGRHSLRRPGVLGG